MWDPEDFDAFYVDTRDRLLHQTFAHTGDLRAARSAVRDAFVIAWHHWPKVSHLDDPEAWVRPIAWRRAIRLHQTHLRDRDHSYAPATHDTMVALSELPPLQRRTFLLHHLAGLTSAEIGRELATKPAQIDELLAQASTAYAISRGQSTTFAKESLNSLLPVLADVSWPRPAFVHRTGAARRRLHSMIGIAAALGLVMGAGALVDRHPTVEVSLADGSVPFVRHERPTDPRERLNMNQLLDDEQIARLGSSYTWKGGEVGDNTTGSGTVIPCQASRFADPAGAGALVKQWTVVKKHPKPRTVGQAAQMLELSWSADEAAKAFSVAQGWYAGCDRKRTRLLSTWNLPDVGVKARVWRYQDWSDPSVELQIGLALTGRVLVTVASQVPAARDGAPVAMGRSLSTAVNDLCGSLIASECAAPPRLQAIAPLAASSNPLLIDEVDLPQAGLIKKPWMGTEPEKATTNAAASQCDLTDFSSSPIFEGSTRTFLIPGARLPQTFGLTESAGRLLNAQAARDYTQDLVRLMSRCSDQHPGINVDQFNSVTSHKAGYHVWRVTTQVSQGNEATFWMAWVRRGDAVAQLGFFPAVTDGAWLSERQFTEIAKRALERLH